MNLNLPEYMNPKGNVQQVTRATSFMAFPVSVSSILNINGKEILYWVFQFYSSRSQFSGLRLLRTVFQQVHNQLVGGQHDGCVRYLPDELGKESSVKGKVAFLPEDQPSGLDKRLVLGAFLPEPRPYDFCREKHILCVTNKLHFQAIWGETSTHTAL